MAITSQPRMPSSPAGSSSAAGRRVLASATSLGRIPSVWLDGFSIWATLGMAATSPCPASRIRPPLRARPAPAARWCTDVPYQKGGARWGGTRVPGRHRPGQLERLPLHRVVLRDPPGSGPPGGGGPGRCSRGGGPQVRSLPAGDTVRPSSRAAAGQNRRAGEIDGGACKPLARPGPRADPADGERRVALTLVSELAAARRLRLPSLVPMTPLRTTLTR